MSSTPLEEVKPKKKKAKKVKPVEPVTVSVNEEVEKVPELTLKQKLKVDVGELDKKIKELFVFTRGPMEGIDKVNQLLLVMQLEQMEAYSITLTKRIELSK